MPIQATNNFIYLIRDETETEKAGLIIPGQGQEKPHSGIIYSIGSLVRDKK
jgi:co-chaperonin GroES (HSP10)